VVLDYCSYGEDRFGVHEPPRSNQPAVAPALDDRLLAVLSKLRKVDAPLGLAIWEIGNAERVGDVIDGIKGIRNHLNVVLDGHQYIGPFSASRWKNATQDAAYRTLSFGINTFFRRWAALRPNLTRPLHYVSIGPGTGEKDKQILEHLQSISGTDTLIYVPIDISAELLRLSFIQTLPVLDLERVAVVPFQLDITDAQSLQELRDVLVALAGDTGTLVSLLGNTVANFQNDRQMLANIASLLPRLNDTLLLELATATKADHDIAAFAVAEYAGSDSFRNARWR
jgi:Histidine-specific methyltransferase, SAM-dependent